MDLLRFALKHGTDKAQHGYTPHYERMLSHFQREPVTLLEMGVWQGASLRMWKEWMPRARIIGLDNNPKTKDRVPEFEIIIADQSKPEDLEALKTYPKFDIIIDDAGHEPKNQLSAWHTLWPLVQSGGWYIIEDLNIDNTTEPSVLLEVTATASLFEIMHGRSSVMEFHVFGHERGDGILFLRKR